jgi:hypothetical protein
MAAERIAVHPLKLNTAAYEHARQLIIAGDLVVDGKGAWRAHQPSTTAKTEFIRQHGFGEYALWHLGIDQSHGEQTKARYTFIFGDLSRVHRCALLAVKSRAHEYGHLEIEQAAAALLELIRSRNKQVESNGYDAAHAVKNASTNSGRSSL